jgi:hypothetical protein
MIAPSQLALKTHTNFGRAASLATLDKLVDRFPLPRLVELTNLYSRLPRRHLKQYVV